nr:unnamed protein product [Callosobruchus analis]
MSWHDHVATIAKTASQKLGVLFRCGKLYTPEELLLLYKAQIRPSLEYCSHNRAVKLIDTDNLTKDLHSLEHRRRVAGLSLFYRFYHGRCSCELSQIITPKTVRTRNTGEALHAHPYQLEVPKPRTSLLQHSFFWKTSTLWNELSGSLFSDGYNLQRFKTNDHINEQQPYTWLQDGQLFPETESFVLAIQDQVIATRNYKKCIIKDPSVVDDNCRKCHQQKETINYTSGCRIFVGAEYTAAKVIHQALATTNQLIENNDPYYNYTPTSVLENNQCKLYWDVEIHTTKLYQPIDQCPLFLLHYIMEVEDEIFLDDDMDIL